MLQFKEIIIDQLNFIQFGWPYQDQILMKKLEKYLLTLFNLNKRQYHQVDFYLEEIFHLLDNHKRNEEAQFRLFEVLIYHQQNCYNLSCVCKSTTFKSAENAILQEDVLKLIESIFFFSLRQKKIQQNQDLYEHISLKYISFIAKYRNNPVKAYYELKLLMSQHSNNISFYFESIQSIISKRIEKMIKLHQEHKMKENKEQNFYYSGFIDDDNNKLQLEDFIFSDQVKSHIIPLISEYLQCKIKVYERMRKGQDKIQQFGNDISQMSQKASDINKQIQIHLGEDISFISQTNQLKRTSQNVYILKNLYYEDLNLLNNVNQILSIYEGVVLNRLQESLRYEELILDLKKRDYLLNQQVMNTLNILKGNMQTIIISLSRDRGMIINKNSKKINSFFGYSQNADFQLQTVEQLMPSFLQEIHGSLMQNYIRRGYSPLIKQSTYSYGQDNYGFLIPMSITIENIFGFRDDFCIYGSMLKLDNAKEFFVINAKGQILGLTKSIYNDVFNIAKENKNLKSKKIHLDDAFDVVQKISFFMIMPEIVDIISKQQQKDEEEEGLDRQNLSSMIETVVSNQQGLIKVPESVIDLHTQFKSNQYFVSEKSKGYSIASLQTNFQQGGDTSEIIESYQNFYKENQIEWNKENLASETKIKYNVVKQRLQYFQDKKKINQVYYILEINEQTSITNDLNRKDSIEIASPKRKTKRQGDMLSPNKNLSPKKLSFFEVIKLAAKKSRLQKQNSQANTISSFVNIDSSPEYNQANKRINQIEQEQDNQSSTSLEKNLIQNKSLSPVRLNKLVDRKSKVLSSFSQLSEKNFGLSLQNVQNIENSLTAIPNTEIASNQNIEMSSRVEDNQLFLKKIQSNHSNHSEKKSPLNRFLGPQFSKNSQPIVKTISREFEPRFTIEEVEKPEDDRIKIKNLFQYSNSIASSAARSPSPSPTKLSLWQRIKNKVSTTTNQSSVLRGATLFLKEKNDNFIEDKADKVFQQPDTISSNSAIDMENEIDLEDSTHVKKGTTTLKRNLKSTHAPITNNQIRSFSQISSRSSNSLSTFLFQTIAYSFHMPSIFLKLKLFFGKNQFNLLNRVEYQYFCKIFIGLFIIMFVLLQLGLSFGIVIEYSQLNEELHFNQVILQDNSEFSIQVLNAINYYSIQAGLIDPKYTQTLRDQITEVSKSYEVNFPSRLQSYLKFQNDDNNLLEVSIFSFQKEQVEKKSLAELKFYNLNSVSQVVQADKNSNQIQVDQFFYLVKNSQTNQNQDIMTLQNVFGDYKNIDNQLDLRANLFIGVYMVVFFSFIICFIPFLKSINSYQERVLQLIARITDGECQQESSKLSDILKNIQNSNESWVFKNFILSDQYNINETLKKSIKSLTYSKIYRMPILSQIKDQQIRNYKQILLFILLSLIGLSYFAIFILLIKQYSYQSYSYLDFFKFSQFAIPSFNSMMIDWSLVISDNSFRKYNKRYPNINIQYSKDDYLASSKQLSNFLFSFSQQLDKLSQIKNSNTDQINRLYTQSICTYYEVENICAQLPETTKSIYKAGLAELISNYFQILKNYDTLIQDDSSDARERILKDYYSSQIFSELILIGYKNTIKFILEIINININSFDSFFDELEKTHLLYFLIYGAFIIILFIIAGYLLYQKSLKRLNNINFGLTCLPQSKVQEESTLQMLKYIKKL